MGLYLARLYNNYTKRIYVVTVIFKHEDKIHVVSYLNKGKYNMKEFFHNDNDIKIEKMNDLDELVKYKNKELIRIYHDKF